MFLKTFKFGAQTVQQGCIYSTFPDKQIVLPRLFPLYLHTLAGPRRSLEIRNRHQTQAGCEHVTSDILEENGHKKKRYSSYVHLRSSLLKLPHRQEGPPTKAHKPGALYPDANPHPRAKIALHHLTGTRCSMDHRLTQSVCYTVVRLTCANQRSC